MNLLNYGMFCTKSELYVGYEAALLEDLHGLSMSIMIDNFYISGKYDNLIMVYIVIYVSQ